MKLEEMAQVPVVGTRCWHKRDEDLASVFRRYPTRCGHLGLDGETATKRTKRLMSLLCGTQITPHLYDGECERHNQDSKHDDDRLPWCLDIGLFCNSISNRKCRKTNCHANDKHSYLGPKKVC